MVTRARVDYFLNAHRNLPLDFEAADKALTYPANDALAFAELAEFYFETGQAEKLAQAADKAITADPDSGDARYWLGQALKQQGQSTDALEKFEGCAQQVTDSHDERPKWCFSEILPVTRTITITLKSDHFTIHTQAQLDTSSADFIHHLSDSEPKETASLLTWGQTGISSGVMYRDYWLYWVMHDSTIIEDNVITAGPEKFYYSYFWDWTYRRYSEPILAIKALPLTAYTMPTTMTIVAEGADVISVTHPYQDIRGNNLTWQANKFKGPDSYLTVAIRPDALNRAKLLWTTHYLDDLGDIPVVALPTILGLIFLLRLRLEATRRALSPAADTHRLYRVFHPQSLLSWLFELMLFAASLVTVLYSIWVIGWEGIVIVGPWIFVADIGVLFVLFARLATLDWYRGGYSQKHFIRLGGLIFIFYLAPRLLYNEFIPLYLALAFLIYRFFLIENHRWLGMLDWPQLLRLFSKQRTDFTRQIFAMDRMVQMEEALEAQGLALAKGKIKPDQYQETRKILNETIQQTKDKVTDLRQTLNLTEDIQPKHVLFGLGPQATPIGNGLIALGYGLVPYFIFLVLISYTETIFDTVDFFGVYSVLFNTAGVPWGPIYLFFFGFFFHVIRGSYGVTKALVFSLSLAGLNFIFQWLWLWDQVDGVEIWGVTLRLLVTFVLTGLLMDWMTIGFSWRQIRLSYESPAATTVISVGVTALTTVITALATGTLNQLLTVAIEGTAAAFGGQSSLGP